MHNKKYDTCTFTNPEVKICNLFNPQAQIASMPINKIMQYGLTSYSCEMCLTHLTEIMIFDQ